MDPADDRIVPEYGRACEPPGLSGCQPAMISSSYEAEGERFTKVRCTAKNPHVSARKCSDRLEHRSDNRLLFRRILHAARQIDVQREDDRPGRRLDPAGPTQPICGSTRASSGLCPQDPIAPGLDDRDILDQTLMLDLERKLVRYSFRRKSTCSMAENPGAVEPEAIDTSGRSALPY